MSVVQSIDDQIMCMVGMGFDLEDCQAAVENGKLSVDEAVEWILNGKPPVFQSTATLRLKVTQNSQMDQANILSAGGNPAPVAPVPVAPQSSGMEASSGATPMDTQSSDSSPADVISRLSMSEEQRQIKLRFEEKQREEARRLAQSDKIAQRKAHADALKRIQEDREKQKVCGTSPPAAGAVEEIPAVATDSGGNVSCPTISRSSIVKDSSSQSTLLQIRLPDGRCIKQSFPADSNLLAVKQFVESQCSNADVCLIQPFPRMEFTDEQMESCLRELGLVPNGSLVVKITSSPSVQAELSSPASVVCQPVDDPALVQPPVPPPMLHFPSPPPAHQQQPQQPPTHDWGAGQHLDADNDSDMDAEEEQVEVPGVVGDMDDVINSDEDDDDDDDDAAAAQIQPMPHNGNLGVVLGGNVPLGHPGFGGGPAGFAGGHHGGFGGGGGGFGGLPGMGGFHGFGGGPPGWGGAGQNQQHNWGAGGQRLAGEVLDNVALPHHGQNPKQLAAEAARKRYGTDSPVETSSTAATGRPAPCIPMLRDLVVKYVSSRICSTRNPVTGLQGLPAALANRVVAYLINEGLLRPKTLQVFNSCRLQEIVLDCYKYCTNELLTVLRHQIFLKSISMHSCPLITKDGLQNLTALKSLRHLNIGSCRQINDNCIPVFIEIPSLVTLVLENTAVTDAGVAMYANSAPQHLQNLDLSRTGVTQNVLPALRAIPQLAKLNLENTKVGGLAGVEGLTNLKVLNLANSMIVTDSLLCLRSHPSLIGLNISNTINVHGDTALQYLADVRLIDIQLPDRITTTDHGIPFISHMPLTALDLTSYINITDISMEHIGKMTGLRKLRLGNTKISDIGMPFLGGLKDLRELHLDRTLITDESTSVLRAFAHLQELNLSHTGITNACLISGALNSCTELSKLNLSKTSVSDKGVRHLSLPVLTLLNIDDTFVRAEHANELPLCPLIEHIVYRSLRIPPPNEDL